MKKPAFILLVSLGLIPFPIFSQSKKDKPQALQDSIWFDQKATELVKSMTLDEKVLQVSFEAPEIARLGIPEHNWWNECLHGVARAGIATVFPQPIGMGAMFDKDLMFRIGDATSDEARAKYNYFRSKRKYGIYQGLTFWSPNINIFRDPRWGRGMETYGEDPYLSGELGVGFIKGLQGDNEKYYKVVATAKHFVVHSGPEEGRHSFNSITGNRDFLLTYTPHFKKAVQVGKAYSIMCAYNRYNDMACCGHNFFDTLLRKQWGFTGYVVSDCGAIDDFYQDNTHKIVKTSAQAAALGIGGGTDLCCGSTYKDLKYAVKDNIINEDAIDVSVHRLMVARLKLGLHSSVTDVPYDTIPYSVVDSKKHQQLAKESALKSMVLLKNQNLLPLSKDAKKILVVGPNANSIDVLLGNYNGFPSSAITILEGIKAKMPNSEIVYRAGSPLAKGLPVFETISEEYLGSVKVNVYGNLYFEGQPIKTFTQNEFNSAWLSTPEFDNIRNQDYSISLVSDITIPETGDYMIGGETYFGSLLYINDVQIKHREQKIGLEKGKKYKLELKYMKSDYDYPILRALWYRPNVDYAKEAVEAAKMADYVIYCMGISPTLEGEEMPVKIHGFSGGDRTSIDLPAIQTDLMKNINAVNKKGVLVLANGSALAINWENENIAAIVEAWYPGQAGGTAVADILFGDYNPSGKLPITFYKSLDQISPFYDYNMKGKTYRYIDHEPLYKFGHGLSYTTFEYSTLNLKPTYATNQAVSFSVKVKNTGKVAGEEVVQVYVSYPGCEFEMPKIALQEFRRVYLKVGETKEVKFALSGEQIAVLNNNNQLEITPGNLLISVGSAQPDNKTLNSKSSLQKQTVLKGDIVSIK